MEKAAPFFASSSAPISISCVWLSPLRVLVSRARRRERFCRVLAGGERAAMEAAESVSVPSS